MSAEMPFPQQPPPPYYAQPPRMVAPPFASYGTRFLAWLLDFLISIVVLIVPMVPVAFALYVSLPEGDADRIIDVIFIPWYLLFVLLYYPLLMRRKGKRNGQTLGKQVMGIRVIRIDGQPIDAGAAILREILVKSLLFGTLSACLLGIPTLLNYLWPAWDDHKQALHDKMVNTYVVEANPGPNESWGYPHPPDQPPPVQWPS